MSGHSNLSPVAKTLLHRAIREDGIKVEGGRRPQGIKVLRGLMWYKAISPGRGRYMLTGKGLRTYENLVQE